MGRTVRHPLFATVLAMAGIAPLAADNLVTPFSELESLEGSGWETLSFPGIDRQSEYELVREQDEQQVVQATADGSASGLIHRLSVSPGDSVILRWRWKVAGILDEGDARTKSGDDYAARVYVAFEFEPDKAGWFERAKRRTVSALFGEELPGRALNYIWANQLADGRMIANAYSGDTMMVAVTSGTRQVGQWVTVERDIVADYQAAFGAPPPNIVGIAIMTDADNTGGTARAWYGDISLSAGGSGLTTRDISAPLPATAP